MDEQRGEAMEREVMMIRRELQKYGTEHRLLEYGRILLAAGEAAKIEAHPR